MTGEQSGALPDAGSAGVTAVPGPEAAVLPARTGGRPTAGQVWRDLLAPRGWRVDVPIAILTMLLGLGLVVSVKTEHGPSGLTVARPDDLVNILADLNTRGQGLQQGITTLEQEQRSLQTGSSGAALLSAQQRAAELGILAGTVAAEGPGVVVTISDPDHAVTADVLVDALEELRDAGAEAMDLSGVRVVVSTSILDTASGISVDGHDLTAPYVITAIGNATTMAEALAIPGGVVDTVADAGGGAQASIASRTQVSITSLRALSTPRYAHPAPTPSTRS